MEKQKPDWVFIESKTLSQKIAYDKNSGWLFCKDGTKYSPAELKRITENFTRPAELPLAVHLAKREFKGEIVSVEKK